MSTSRSRITKFSWIVGAALMLPTMTGCVQFGSALPDPVEYACTWTNDAGDRFTLSSYASAEIAVSSELLLSDTLTSLGFVDGEIFEAEARWQIGDSLYYRDFRGDPVVTMFIETSQGPITWTVSADRRGGDLILMAPEPDPDKYTRTVFTSSDCLQEVFDRAG